MALIAETLRPHRGEPPFPALVLLHGLGSDERDLPALAAGLEAGLYVVSIRAPFRYAGGGYMWYDIDRDGPGLGSPSIEAGLTELTDCIAQLPSRYPVDPDRIIVGGFSQGAAMAGAHALLEPGSIAGAIMMSGYLPPGDLARYRTEEAAGLPIFQAHGTLDQVVPIEAARQTRAFLGTTPVKLTYREYSIGHQVSVEELGDVQAWLETALRVTQSETL